MMLCVNWIWSLDQQNSLEYSEVRQLFEQEKVESFSISNRDILTMELRGVPEGQETQACRIDFQLFYTDLNDLVLEQKAAGIINDYNYPTPKTTTWMELALPGILAAIVFAVVMVVLLSIRA